MKLVRYRARAALAAVTTLPLVAGALAAGATAAQADPHGRQLLSATKPLWATAQADHGAVPAGTTVNARVYLAGQDPAGLAAYARAVSDPGSADYHHYLDAAQAADRYGATGQQVKAVTGWLTSAGMKVTATTRHYLAVRGDASAVQQAFDTTLHEFTAGGTTYRAPATPASVPDSLHGAVLTVTGLDDAPSYARSDSTTGGPGGPGAQQLPFGLGPSGPGPATTKLPPPEAVFRNAGPFSTYYGSTVDDALPEANGTHEPYAIHGYTGEQLRAAYGAGPYTGRGSTVAIVDAYADPYIAQDAAEYARRNDGAPYRSGQFSQVLPADYNSLQQCAAAGWYGEETLDVEAVHAVAPDADITYVGASSCNDDDLLDALSKVVDNRLADIVSDSWSDVESNATPDSTGAYDLIFELGAVEGVGFYFATGDDGDYQAALGSKQVGTPADSPWATAVGGSSLAVGQGDAYQWETGWGTDKAPLSADRASWTGFPGPFTSGAGGGTSVLYEQPFYQQGVVPDALSEAAGPTPMRVLPDISADADPTTGLLVGQSQSFPDGSIRYSEYRIGGTSLACPLIAAIQALAQQAQYGVPIGFANPAIYQRYGTPLYHDVTDQPLGAGVGIADVRVDYANSYDASKGLLVSLRSLGRDSSLHATPGYDDVTGVGTPAPGYVASYRPGG